jgi:hypothetical protein
LNRPILPAKAFEKFMPQTFLGCNKNRSVLIRFLLPTRALQALDPVAFRPRWAAD